MRYPSSGPFLVLVAAGALWAAPALPALAAETAGSDLVIITEGDTVDGDLYAAGLRVVIEGTVDGDLIAFAAEEVLVADTGEVTGSITAVSPSAEVAGNVGGSVRAAGNDLTISGSIEGDVVGAVFRGALPVGSEVGGDVVLWAWEATAAGTIEGDLEGTQRGLELSGVVGGDVSVSVNRLTVTGPLEVDGDLVYRSPVEAEGLDQVDAGGVVVRQSPVAPNIRVRALGLLARLLVVLGLTSAALLVAWQRPDRTRAAAEQVRRRPFRAFGLGALVIFSPLLLLAITALLVVLTPASASVPLLAIFAPLIVATTGIVFALSLVSGIPTVTAIGDALPGSRGVAGATLLGSIVVGVVWMIPLIGWLIPLLVLPTGLGAWFLSLRRR